jgi:hypothetical protein
MLLLFYFIKKSIKGQHNTLFVVKKAEDNPNKMRKSRDMEYKLIPTKKIGIQMLAQWRANSIFQVLKHIYGERNAVSR